jgi:hypothetical protein
MTVDAWRVGPTNANVVKHCAAIEYICIQMQFGMSCCHAECMCRYLGAMVNEQAAQLIVLGIMFLDDF